jgi:predicted transposase YbfD/YdcC
MNLPERFSSIEDFRVQGRCLHQLGDILGLVLCGTLSDCDDFSEIEDYGHDNLELLRQELGLELANGVPSQDTLERVIRHLDSGQLEACFKACLEGLSLQGRHLRLDGKELRGTVPAGRKHALVQMVNVWVDELSVSFGQLQVEQKSNEITAIPALLDTVDCQGSVVSIDAIGCQREIAGKIVDKQADYVIALKANQGGLYEQVADFMEKRKESLPLFQSLDKDHGRGERRRVYLAQDIGLVDEAGKWPGLRSLLLVERERITALGKVQSQRQFYISSLAGASPQACSAYVRGHSRDRERAALAAGLHLRGGRLPGEEGQRAG